MNNNGMRCVALNRGVLEPFQISKMHFFAEQVNSFQWLTIFGVLVHRKAFSIRLCLMKCLIYLN